MASGDGLIVRVKPRGASLTLRQAGAIAAAAARHGNGLIDLTTRANLQIRGVSEERLVSLTVELDARGLLDADAGAEARRNVLAAPLMGLDPSAAFDIRPAVAALEARLAAATELAALPSKFGVAVCDGGALPLGDVSADIRCDAGPDGRFTLRLDGDDVGVARCRPDELAEAVLRLARAFVAVRARDPECDRMRDVVADVGADVVRDAAGLGAPVGPPRQPVAPRPTPTCVGILPLADGTRVLGVAAPFGRLDAGQCETLVAAAGRAGAAALRVTPWRALLVPGLSAEGAAALAASCRDAGLVVEAGDPRLRVAACAGAPGCRRATTPVLDHAARFAALLGPGEAGTGIALHVSGCQKGCAHPRSAPLTLVAAAGRYALVADGAAGDAPVAAGLDAEETRRLLKTTLRWDRHS
jgi:precorrin-3B synthase